MPHRRRMVDKCIKILPILRHYCELGLKDSKTLHKNSELDRNETISNHSTYNLFNCFKCSDLLFEIKLRWQETSAVDYDA